MAHRNGCALKVPESYKKIGTARLNLFKGNIPKEGDEVKNLAGEEFPIPIFFRYPNRKFRSTIHKKK